MGCAQLNSKKKLDRLRINQFSAYKPIWFTFVGGEFNFLHHYGSMKDQYLKDLSEKAQFCQTLSDAEQETAASRVEVRTSSKMGHTYFLNNCIHPSSLTLIKHLIKARIYLKFSRSFALILPQTVRRAAVWPQQQTSGRHRVENESILGRWRLFVKSRGKSKLNFCLATKFWNYTGKILKKTGSLD